MPCGYGIGFSVSHNLDTVVQERSLLFTLTRVKGVLGVTDSLHGCQQ